MRICIIKLGALGDVLRTTCILPGLWSKYQRPQITWVTETTAVPLLAGNPYISRVVPIDEVRQEDAYDLVISLDEEAEACALSSVFAAHKWFGACIIAKPTRPFRRKKTAEASMGATAQNSTKAFTTPVSEFASRRVNKRSGRPISELDSLPSAGDIQVKPAELPDHLIECKAPRDCFPRVLPDDFQLLG